MGKFRSTFKPQYSAALADRAHTVSAAAKAQPAVAVPGPKLERVAAKPRTVMAVSNAQPDVKPVSNGAARVARWRSKQDPEVRRQQNREAVQRHRAKKKVGGS